MAEPFEDVCQRCGEFTLGRKQWMFQQGEAPGKQFYCSRCLRVMRISAIIGFTLLGLLVAGLFAACWWIGVF